MEVASATDIRTPDTGSLRGDLIALLVGIFNAVATHRPAQAIKGLLSEAQFDPDFAQEFRAYIRTRRKLCLEIVEKARLRGELQPEADAELVADLIYGAYWNRVLIGHAPLSVAFAEQVVDTLLAGIAS